MGSETHKINCPTCKSHLLVKSTVCYAYSVFKMVRCPNCNTPLREIRTDLDFSIIKEIPQDI